MDVTVVEGQDDTHIDTEISTVAAAKYQYALSERTPIPQISPLKSFPFDSLSGSPYLNPILKKVFNLLI